MCFTQKRIRCWEDQLSGGFIHHFEPIRALKILFYLGGKRFQCPGPGNKLTLYHWKKGFTQNARSGTRVFKTRVPNAQPYRTNVLIYIYIYIKPCYIRTILRNLLYTYIDDHSIKTTMDHIGIFPSITAIGGKNTFKANRQMYPHSNACKNHGVLLMSVQQQQKHLSG